MYVILLHIAGIAIVEIIFFFKYIGPIETQIFTEALHEVMDDSINNNLNFIILKPNITNLIDEYITNGDINLNDEYTTQNLNDETNIDDIDTRDDTNIYMEELYYEGVDKREKYNNELFIQTVSYWAIGFVITLIITFIELKIRSYYKNKNNTLDRSKSEQSIELVHTRVRTNSVEIDYQPTENDIENNAIIENKYLENNDDKKNYKKIIKKTLYYTFGACLLLGFQYTFFQHVALKYEPLSSNELQYILYKILYNDLNEVNQANEINLN